MSSSDIFLTIAIPTYKNLRQLVDCLTTLTRYQEFPVRLLVVNNGPELDRDGRPFEEGLRHFIDYPELTVIQAEENLGWAGAINAAFLAAPQTPLFCMANDDLVFLPYHRYLLRQMCSHFADPKVGAVGPRSNFVAGSQNFLFHHSPPLYETTLLIGFFMILRSEAFSRAGPLDESLPGGDDYDLSIRIRKLGYKLLVDGSAYIHHWGSQTGRRLHDYWNSLEHMELTNNLLINKHGLREWYETLNSRIIPYVADSSGAGIDEHKKLAAYVEGLEKGLDLGCGDRKVVDRAVGVDLRPRGEKGLAGGQRGKQSAADITADVCSLPVDDSSQDFLIASHIIEHILDPLAALKEWRRVLKPGGTLVMALPDHGVCNSILIDFTHIHAYTSESLTNLLKSRGFVVEKAEPIRPGISFVLKAGKPIELSPYEVVTLHDVTERGAVQ